MTTGKQIMMQYEDMICRVMGTDAMMEPLTTQAADAWTGGIHVTYNVT